MKPGAVPVVAGDTAALRALGLAGLLLEERLGDRDNVAQLVRGRAEAGESSSPSFVAPGCARQSATALRVRSSALRLKASLQIARRS